MKMTLMVTALLVALVLASAIAVIYSKHESRKLFVQLQMLHKQVDEINVEWGRLQLEQSAWSSHGRIEKIARNKLNMKLPKADEILYIKQ